LAALLLGVVAVLLSPVLLGTLPGVAGVVTGTVHLRRSQERRGMAWLGLALSGTGTLLGLAWAYLLAVLVLHFIPGGAGRVFTPPAAEADVAAADAQATYVDGGLLADKEPAKALVLSSFCLNQEGDLLACDEEGRCIRVIGPDNALKATWPLDFWPQAISCRADGSVVVAGAGRIALLDGVGQPLAAGDLPQASGGSAGSRGKAADARARYESAATSAATMGEDVFVCARTGTGYTIYRLGPGLDGATPVVKGLRGCCGQLDMTARDGVLYVAANSEFKVLEYDRDGKSLGSFGRTGKGPEFCFDGCCEPKNLAFGPDGSLYLAGSGKCAVSRYTADGTFLEYVGRVPGITGCVRVTLAVNQDASRVYMLDTDRNVIRVLARKEPPPAVPAAEPAPAVSP